MSDSTPFSASEWQRYSRHLQLPQVGASGQLRLKNASVLIVGAGGLGSPVALYLAAAGIGKITIVDHDQVELSNLQRQILFTNDNLHHSKAQSAKENLQRLNEHCEINAIVEAFTSDKASELVRANDFIIDCTDNFATRYAINDACIKSKTPWLYASIHQFSGQCALFTPGKACFRCLFPEAPSDAPDCNSAGVLGVLPGLLGTLQANEAIKYLLKLETPLDGQLLLVDALKLSFQKIAFTQNPNCLCCNPETFAQNNLHNVEEHCSNNETVESIACEDLEKFLDAGAQLLDVREDSERAAFHIEGMHIPLGELEQRIQELPRGKTIICYCQSGMRSEIAVKLLLQSNRMAMNLRNGLAEYTQRVTPKL